MSSDPTVHPDRSAADLSAVGPATASRGHRLDCLEVWGGSTGIDSTVAVTGLDVWAFSQPADDVAGGDLYLVSMCACAEVSRFLVADVTGHDAEAAQVAMRLRKIMRKHINKPDQTRLARSLNQDFDGMARHGKFATAVLATFFPPTRHLIVCNAGHPRPMWYRTAQQRWSVPDPEASDAIEDVSNLPLGIHDDAPYAQFAIRLARDDLVLIYTDGLTEARTSQGRMLGEQGVLELVRRLDPRDPAQFLASLRAALDRVAGDSLRSDDVTMLLLRATGEQPPQQSLVQKIRVTAKMLGLLPTSR